MKIFSSPVGPIQIKRVQVKYAASLFHAIATSREQMATFLPWAKELTLKDEKDFLFREKDRHYHGQPLVFAIIVNSQPAGMLDLHQVNQKDASAEIGYWLSFDYQNQGIISQAVVEIQDYAFSKLKLTKLRLNIKPDNIASQRVAEKTGFLQTTTDNEFIIYEVNK
ncbi:GNAT family N-acetyltransferase [Fructobacillus sp. M1-13]|uniref:GNAT family N-acetyltransferase n=1 Tax=Fructobacillus papyriferae TaxID=2713171 RepID=A0ABS5QNW2_9LACO|nr:GNAT family N-acetyltransferase [Fructobacillus papyriferae]MBS9334840.1 GNAT family N-acetyltransferase [Fructobacillus papyriferae]MCD2158830.1 GNAT family N-acetyltransferase [Fructobacillus papyriferae]